MPDGYEVAHVDELEALPVVDGRLVWRPVRRRFGIEASGTLVFVRPGTRRVAIAREAGTAVLAVGAKPGEVFTPSGWEDGFIAFAYLKLGREEEGRAVMLSAVERAQDWRAPYNLACFEALTGRPEDALAALRRAAELDPEEVRRYAADEADLASLRHDPRFAELTS